MLDQILDAYGDGDPRSTETLRGDVGIALKSFADFVRARPEPRHPLLFRHGASTARSDFLIDFVGRAATIPDLRNVKPLGT
ncbi:MAG: hypothetical protein M3P01_10645 [Actinomycetota bacterium]|nr:hypothetical protein [Actinomycetota bacterium]